MTITNFKWQCIRTNLEKGFNINIFIPLQLKKQFQLGELDSA